MIKMCNSDIHTSISHFMEIQQKEKESLASYSTGLKQKLRDAILQIMLPP